MTNVALMKFLFGTDVATALPQTVMCTSTLLSSSASCQVSVAGRTLHILEVSSMMASTSGIHWKSHLFEKCLPYVGAAFHEDLATMPEESRRQHYLHLLNGERLYLAVVETTAEDGADGLPVFQAAGHCLTSVHKVEGGMPMDDGGNQLHIDGMVVNPSIQGAGVGAALLHAAISSALSLLETNVPLFVSARTQNEAILKIFYGVGSKTRCSSMGSQLSVFPVRDEDTDVRGEVAVLQAVAQATARKQNAGAVYLSEKGVFPAMYPPLLRRVFGGDPSFPSKKSSIPMHRNLRDHMDVVNGDAALLVMQIR